MNLEKVIFGFFIVLAATLSAVGTVPVAGAVQSRLD